MKKLIKGLHKFQTEVFPIKKDFFQDLTKGQHPEILFISCSDSRINPNLVTQADPGDLFILRNAGNIIPAYSTHNSEAATIEFAICELKIEHIIVCGHSHCGALEATLHPEQLINQPSLYNWLSTNVTPTLDLINENYTHLDQPARMDILLQEHVLQQIENLKTHPVVNKAIADHMLTLHAWIYEFEHGDIFSFNTINGQFELIKHF